ncbi:uncharacterized protein K441DRAFT_24766 [Cenococcum geophilum 1.58]|uniref:uncharacterized protein n=1 Tax=Cenococcum geophilum 1.58 TaxID=794803 RepID=UPI00358E3586|nr:hypothetical protein K441DRAFT_24766 [Cenococcum geophilum 1.58]
MHCLSRCTPKLAVCLVDMMHALSFHLNPPHIRAAFRNHVLLATPSLFPANAETA